MKKLSSELDEQGLKSFYQKKEVAAQFLEARFSSPYGKVLHHRQFDFVIKQIQKYHPQKVLDLACGPARSYPVLSQLSQPVFYDGSWEMLKQVKERIQNKGLLLQGDGFQLPFKQVFDMVVSLRFIRHFKYEQRQRIYSEIRSILKPGGVLIFDAVNFNVSYPVREIDKGLNGQIYDKLYKWWELELELQENGFKLIDSQGVYYQYLQARYLERVFRKFKLKALGYSFLSWLEKRQHGEPLEWMVACQK